MADQREFIGSLEESVRAAIDGYNAELWTALPGIVISFDPEKMTCVVQPTIRAYVRASDGSQQWQTLPILRDCPICFPCGGGFAFTLPIAQGDEVLVIFASRCIDAWFQSGAVSTQAQFRMHDLSDGFVIPGPRSLPNVPGGISQTNAQLRTEDGSAYIELTPTGAVNIVAPGGFNVNGQTQIVGNTAVTGTVAATGDGTFESTSVHNHLHGGVQTGGGDTGPPI